VHLLVGDNKKYPKLIKTLIRMGLWEIVFLKRLINTY
jgi:hypothetical protein